MWLNLYGFEAVRHKLKNSLKTQKMHFLPVFELEKPVKGHVRELDLYEYWIRRISFIVEMLTLFANLNFWTFFFKTVDS